MTAGGGQTPFAVMVAPNGARRTKADHPALPMTAWDLAEAAVDCVAAGAAAMHVHVRDDDGAHVLDAARYREALAAIRAEVGDALVLQITTEAVGRYAPPEQMAVVRAVRPEAVSVAIREIVPDEAALPATRAFLHEIAAEGIWPQYIVYSAADLERLFILRERDVVPPGPLCALFVLGRYAASGRGSPLDLVPFLDLWSDRAEPWDSWFVCAFGAEEARAAGAAAALGGHARVGFENNLWTPDGTWASNNAALVVPVAAAARAMGRDLASAQWVRRLNGRDS